MRDSQKYRLYNAESEVSWGKRFRTVDEAQQYLERCCEHRWLLEKYRCEQLVKIGAPRLVAVPQRRRWATARASSWEIRIPARAQWALDQLCLLHELAHLLVRGMLRTPGDSPDMGPAHGRGYCRLYLDLVRHYMGPEQARQLRAAFRRNGVKWHRLRPRLVVSADEKRVQKLAMAHLRAMKKLKRRPEAK